MVSRAKISQFLEGIDFPAGRQQIIEYAQNNNAPSDVLDMLEQLPDTVYYSIAGIWEAISKVA
jgi:Tfp pilus assembly protein PilN